MTEFSKVRKSITIDLESGGKVSLTEGIDNKVRLSITDSDDDSCEFSVVISKKEFHTLYWQDGSIHWPDEPEEELRRGVNTSEPVGGLRSISDSTNGEPL